MAVGGKTALGTNGTENKGLRLEPNKCGHSGSSDDDGATSPLRATLGICSDAIVARQIMCVAGGGAESLFERVMEARWAGDGGGGGVATGAPDEPRAHGNRGGEQVRCTCNDENGIE